MRTAGDRDKLLVIRFDTMLTTMAVVLTMMAVVLTMMAVVLDVRLHKLCRWSGM